MEHSYSRDTRPTDKKTMNTRTILVHRPPPCPSCHSSTAQEQEIDMNETSIPLPHTIPKIDEQAAREAMNAIGVIAAKVKNRNAEDDDWEEHIDKVGWTGYQHTLFSKFTDILAMDRLARCTQLNHPNEPVLRRASIDKAVHRMRKALSVIHWDIKLTQWIHGLLCDNLPVSYMTAYMDILQTLRVKVPASLMTNMLQGRSNDLLEAVMKPPWEPVPEVKDRKITPEPMILIVPSSLPTGRIGKEARETNWLALFATMSSFVQRLQIPEDFPPLDDMPINDTLEKLVTLTRLKLHELRKENPQRKLILVGFNMGSALALQVAALEQSLSCVICMGFASSTLRGARGNLDDRLVELQTPVLFVVGQNATRSSQEQIESLREQMLAPTALVVVGSADDCLQVNRQKRCLEKVTQSMVDSMVMDEVAEFTNNCITNPPTATKRRPVATASATYVISDSPKDKVSKSAGVNGGSARKSGQTKSPVKSGRVNKKKLLDRITGGGCMSTKLNKEITISTLPAGTTTNYEIVNGKIAASTVVQVKSESGGTAIVPKWQLSKGATVMLPLIQKQKISLGNQFTPMRSNNNLYTINSNGKKIYSLTAADVTETIELDTDEEVINIDGDPVMDAQVVTGQEMELSVAGDISGIPVVFQDSEGNIQEPINVPEVKTTNPPAVITSNVIVTSHQIIPRPNKYVYYKPQQQTIINKSSQQYVVLSSVDEKRTVTSAPTSAGPGGMISSKPLIISVESLDKGTPSTVYHVVSDSEKEE